MPLFYGAGLLLALLSMGAAPAPNRKPSLEVVLVVDGVSQETLDASRAALGGGLARLLREGRVEPECNYRHFITETAPGHAALATGAPPSVTGVVGNFWSERTAAGKLETVDAVSDPTPDPALPRGSASLYGPERLLVPTLGDRLVAKSADSRVVSISGKYRSAILMAGKDKRHSVWWLDPRTASFQTTSYYDARTPAQAATARVVEKINGERPLAELEKRYGASWTRLPGSTMKSASPTELLRFQLPALGRLFPHPLAQQRGGYAPAFYLSPYADEHLADLAVALLGDDALALGRRDAPDVLAISFSTFDHIAHRYGPESMEALDALDRIDRAIGRVLAAVDEKVPKDAVAVALSSDHGFLPIRDVRRPVTRTEPGEDPTIPHGRLVLERFPEALSAELDRALCLDPSARPIGAVEKWLLYYTPGALPAKTVEGPCGPAGKEIGRREVDAALPKALATAFPGSFDGVLVAADRARWSAEDPAVEAARNTFRADRSGDAFLIPHYGEVMHWDKDTRGSDHGSPRSYDTHVPLIFRGAAFPAGQASGASTPYDLAPTLAALLGVDLPDATGKSRVPVSAGTPRPR